VRLLPGVHDLTVGLTSGIVRRAVISAHERFGVKVIDFWFDAYSLRLVVETPGELALGRAMKGLGVRLARRLNKAAGRKGQVIAHRYHARSLKTAAETRSALRGASRHHEGLARRQPRTAHPGRAGLLRRVVQRLLGGLRSLHPAAPPTTMPPS